VRLRTFYCQLEFVRKKTRPLFLQQFVGELVGFESEVVGAFQIAFGGGGLRLFDERADMLDHGLFVIAERTVDAAKRVFRRGDQLCGIEFLMQRFVMGDRGS
jgi:hypothetical protein